MSDNTGKKYRHFILAGIAQSERFRPPRRRIERKPLPERDRRSHGAALLGQIDGLKPNLENARREQESAGLTRISHQPSQRERQNAREFWARGPETRGGVLLAR